MQNSIIAAYSEKPEKVSSIYKKCFSLFFCTSKLNNGADTLYSSGAKIAFNANFGSINQRKCKDSASSRDCFVCPNELQGVYAMFFRKGKRKGKSAQNLFSFKADFDRSWNSWKYSKRMHSIFICQFTRRIRNILLLSKTKAKARFIWSWKRNEIFCNQTECCWPNIKSHGVYVIICSEYWERKQMP